MAGVYIHIPFCKKACNYCNFHFSTNTSTVQRFIEALLMEIKLRRQYTNQPIETIYFGGGTPSLLPGEQLQTIINAVTITYPITATAEFTLEANPDDITPEKLILWKQAGINRLSIGVQSFFEDDLLWMNRAHNASQAQQAVTFAKQFGFNNLTIDLIYGTPTLTDEQWYANVHRAIDLEVNHLSCYALTVEPKTALNTLINQKKMPPVEEEKQARHFELLMDWMAAAGYEHYEISNFAKPGHRSRHNSSYWQRKHYIGFGPSAHSFNGQSRQWNVANNTLYIESLKKGTLPFEQELLSQRDQLNEYIMTSLRTMEGIRLKVVEDLFGREARHDLLKNAGAYISNKLLLHNANHLLLTRQGKLRADGIAADLFRV
jgi:oxygen-independent coproporphyrinogen-3 oxidase